MTYPGAYGTPAYGPPPGANFTGVRRPRPVAVTIAAIALFVIALLGLFSAMASFLEAGPAGDRVTTGADDANTVTFALVFYGVIALVTAVYYVIAAMFALRGNRGMRIATWVVAGLTVLCLGCNGLSNGVLASGVDRTAIDNSNNAGSLVLDSQSHTYVVTTATLEVITTLVAIVTIILLAIPASNAYFRKADATAAMYAAYGYPGYGYAYPGQGNPGAQPAGGYAPTGYPQWQSAPPPGEPAPWQQPGQPAGPGLAPSAPAPSQPAAEQPASSQPAATSPWQPSTSYEPPDTVPATPPPGAPPSDASAGPDVAPAKPTHTNPDDPSDSTA
jgi:hypothetical protein